MANLIFTGSAGFVSFLSLDLSTLGFEGPESGEQADTFIKNFSLTRSVQFITADTPSDILTDGMLHTIRFVFDGVPLNSVVFSQINMSFQAFDQFSDGPITDLWNYVLAGDDNITLNGPISRVFGDYDSLTNKTISAGDDTFRLGSDLTMTSSTGLSATGYGVVGDVADVLGSTVLRCGDDLIDATLVTANEIFLVGDVLSRSITTSVFYGDDIILGGAGIDRIYGDNFSSFTGKGGNDELFGMGGADFIYGGGGNDSIDGGEGGDLLKGDGGDDTILGGEGFDAIYGGSGRNTLEGGAGNDNYYVETSLDSVIETDASTITGGIDTLMVTGSSGTFKLAANVENLSMLDATGAVNGTGNSLVNSLVGNGFANTLNGKGGADFMDGDDGDDVYIADMLDTVSEGNASVSVGGRDLVTVSGTSGTFVLSANIENLTLSGSSAISGTGNAARNVLTGNSANNTLSGLAGIDILDGGKGRDTLIGGNGSDIYIVDVTTDIITETSSSLSTGGRDIATFIGTTGTFTLSNNVEDLVLGGRSAIGGTGNTLANSITGNSAANTISGKGGNDRLIGGSGADTFVFDTALNSTTNVDNIRDFRSGTDKIKLENGVFIGISAGNLADSALWEFAYEAPSPNWRLKYDLFTGYLTYDRDGSGNVYSAVLFATLPELRELSHTDFIVI